jgi:NitT/TauT family transport system substrate-binding protein
LRAAKQYGLGYVQYMLMEDLKLVEKRAKAAGLGDITVEWNTFRSSDVMNDALLSGSVDFVSLGVPGLMTIWDRTKGVMDVKGASGLNALPIALMVRDDNVKSLKDFTDQHRIAMPAVRVSNQAILLQMACEKEFGAGNHNKLDTIAITMAHPDATIAMISGSRDVTATSPRCHSRTARQDARHPPPADLDRHSRRAVLVQHRRHHLEVPRREPQALQGLPRRIERGDGDRQ